MHWYVLQTKTGGEEKLVELIRQILPRYLYGECFVIYQEQLWRRQQRNLVHVKRAFPGYVFITSKEPEALFLCLKQIPAMSKMIADDDFFFLSVNPVEADFLKQIMNPKHVICLSYVSTDGRGHIYQVSGPLETCKSQIVCWRFGKRYALVRLRLLGEEKKVLLGIVLKEDVCHELRYGRVEAPIRVPEQYLPSKAPEREKSDDLKIFAPGTAVRVVSGAFEGMQGVIYKVGSQAAKVGIHLFGQDMAVEMPIESLCSLPGKTKRRAGLVV